MYEQGHHVVGVEGVEQPILEFFAEQGLSFLKKEEADLTVYCVSIKNTIK